MLIKYMAKMSMSLLILIIAGTYYMEARKGDPLDQMLIRPVFWMMFILFFIIAYRDWKKVASEEKALPKTFAFLLKENKISLIFLLIVASLLLIIPVVGFLFASILFLATSMYVCKIRDMTLIAGVSIGLPLLLTAIFKYAFEIPLPSGLLGI